MTQKVNACLERCNDEKSYIIRNDSSHKKGTLDEKGISSNVGGDLTVVSAVVGVCKSAIGAGALAIPVFFARLGLFPGIMALFVASFTCTVSLHLLNRLAIHTNSTSYNAISRLAFNRTGDLTATLCLALFLFGTLIYYIAEAGSQIVSGVQTLFNCSINEKWTVVVVAFAIYPFACLRDMRLLSRTSVVGMLCMIYILALCAAHCLFGTATDTNGNLPGSVQLINTFTFDTAIKCFSSFLFSFVNHFTLVASVPILQRPTSVRRAVLVGSSSLFVFLFYLILGLFGYFSYGPALGSVDNILQAQSDPKFSVAFGIASLSFSLMLILSFPLLCDPLRASIEQLVLPKKAVANGTDNVGSGKLSHDDGDLKASKNNSSLQITSPFDIRSLLLTAILVLLPTLIALFLKKIALTILQLFTAFSGSMLVFIIPVLLFFKLSNASGSVKCSAYRISFTERVLAISNFIFGILLMVFGTYVGVKSLIEYFTSN